MANKRLITGEVTLGIAFLLLLWVTRSSVVTSHFGSALNLPDASWAVFWLLGFWTIRIHWLITAFIASVTADYFAIQYGTSADCFTSAYLFLIPAYSSLWVAGRWAQHRLTPQVKSWPLISLSVFTGVFICFALTNSGMYIACHSVDSLSAWEYTLAIAHYLPMYLATTGMYVGIAALTGHLIKKITLLTDSVQHT